MIGKTILLILAILGTAAFGAACHDGDTVVTVSPGEQTGIVVIGIGRVTVVPDVGELMLGVDVQRSTVEAARNAAAQSMDAVREALKHNGVADSDIATRSFTITPQYQVDSNRVRRISGYRVANQVRAKVRDLNKVSSALDAAVAAGGDNMRVQTVVFTVDKPERYLAEARKKAVADARDRGEQLAKLSGERLGRVRFITESTNGRPLVPLPVARGVAEAVQAEPPTPLSPGESEIVMTVSITFAVGR